MYHYHKISLPVVVLTMWIFAFTHTVLGQTPEQQMSPGLRFSPVSLQQCIRVNLLYLHICYFNMF